MSPILDFSCLKAIAQNDKKIRAKAAICKNVHKKLTTSAMTVYLYLRRTKLANAVFKFAMWEVLDMDLPVADEADRIRRSHNTVNDEVVLIMAQAVVSRRPIATANAKQYPRWNGVTIEDWSR